MELLPFFIFFVILHCTYSQSTNISELIRINCKSSDFSNICDPTNILDSQTHQKINTILKSTFSSTCAPTPAPKDENDDEDDTDDKNDDEKFLCRCGVHSYLVVVHNLDGSSVGEKNLQSNILANRVLSTKEQVSCSIVMIATEEEKIFGIAVGNDAKEYLPDACLFPIYQSSDVYNFTHQLNDKINEYSQIIKQKHSCNNSVAMDSDSDMRRKVAIPILLLLSVLIIAIIIGIYILCKRRHKNSANADSEASRRLNDSKV